MRLMVIQREVSQLWEAIKETYNKAAKTPYFTVIFVNKKIHQRFFYNNGSYLENPPPGTLIDGQVVCNSQDQKEFDFYLVPQQVTQGCCLPTHYYVAINDSPLKPDTIKKMTYDLSHFYFNWSGPIKVPAPCMYSHKIAELFMNLSKRAKKRDDDEDMQKDGQDQAERKLPDWDGTQFVTKRFNQFLHFL